MFRWVKRKISESEYNLNNAIREACREVNCNMQFIQKQIGVLQEQIDVINKLYVKKESRIIEATRIYSPLDLDFAIDEQQMEKEREELRSDGFSFCHKKKNGDEVWAKYPQENKGKK